MFRERRKASDMGDSVGETGERPRAENKWTSGTRVGGMRRRRKRVAGDVDGSRRESANRKRAVRGNNGGKKDRK